MFRSLRHAVLVASLLPVLACAGNGTDDLDDGPGDDGGAGGQSTGGAMAGMGGQSAGGAMAGMGGQATSSAFVVRRSAALELEGKPFRAVGTNLYFLQEIATRAVKGQQDFARQLGEVLDEAAARGFGVVRVWGYNDDANKDSVIRTGPQVYVEAGLRGLDRAVKEAKARGLRLIVTLANNWDEYGGVGANGYAKWAGGGKTHDDFFTDATMKQYWKDYAMMLVNRVNADTGVRYGDEPAILAWEIANELRCPSCKGTRKVRDAVAELATFLRGIDAKHLIGDGGEGFDDRPELYPGLTNTYAVRGDEGATYAALVDVPELDLMSYHFYPVNWGLENSDHAIWIERHEAIARSAGKVAYLGEYGYKLADGAQGAAADGRWATMYGGWLMRLFGTADGAVALQWQLVPTRGPYTDEFAIRRGDNPKVLELLETFGAMSRP